MKTTRRLFALLMVVCLLAGYVVLPASAESSDTPAATLSFADTTARTSLSDEEQVWKANGITFTNSKGEAKSNLTDTSNPVRLYANTGVKVEYPGMTKIVFTCAGGKNITADDLSGLGTVTINGSVITLELSAPADSISFVVGAQRRVMELAVYTGSTEPGDPSEPTTEPTEAPTEPEDPVEEIKDGTYVISTNGLTFAALDESKTYGYAPANDASAYTEVDVMTITNVEGGFTMQDCYGRYVYMSGTYNSFNVSTTAPTEGHVWQLKNNGTNLYMVNVAKDKTLAYSANYKTWGAYAALTDDHSTALTIAVYEAPAPVPGESAENPLYVEFGESTITVEPGETVYVALIYTGAELTVNDGEPIAITGSRFMPQIEKITNDGTEAAEYKLVIGYPLGHEQNPEALILGSQYTNLAEGNEVGYFYQYTAESDGKLSLSVDSAPEGVEIDIAVTIGYAQKTLLLDGVEGVLTLDVSKGDELRISVSAFDSKTWTFPAAEVTWNINYPVGSELNPLRPEFVWNEEGSAGEYTITVGAGETFYLELVQKGTELTVNGGEPIPITGNRFWAQSYTITNEGTEPAAYKLVVSYPVGSINNPEDIEEGETKVTFEENTEGYHYDFVAPATGTVTLKVSGETWQYSLTNKTQSTSTDAHYHDDTNVVDTETIEVKKGDVIVIFVSTYDPNDWFYGPAGEVTMSFSFKSAVVPGDVDGDGIVGIVDLMKLANFFAGKGSEINVENADVDGDGEVTIRDLMRLANHFAGKDTLG